MLVMSAWSMYDEFGNAPISLRKSTSHGARYSRNQRLGLIEEASALLSHFLNPTMSDL